MRTRLTGGTIYTPDEVIENGVIVVEGGKILEVGPASSSENVEEEIDVSGLWLAPGLIDLHLHGIEGSDLMADGAVSVAKKIVRSGVTSFLATTMTAAIDELKTVVGGIASCRPSSGAELLGIHLEGPYISPLQPGMMDVSQCRPFDWDEMQGLIEVGEGMVRMITLAPEIPGATEGIAKLERAGIIASVGHSHATFDEMRQAVDRGLRHATHVFNAMRGFHHREPGTVGGVLDSAEIVAQVIVDGQHLHPVTVDLLLKTKGVDGLALISDVTMLAGLKPGEYHWRGAVLEVKCGRAQLKRGGGLAGSVWMMNHGLQLLVENAGLSLADALKAATKTPARVLGLAHKKGRLAPGWDADIAAFDEHYHCRLAIVGGKIVYRATRR